MLTWIIGSTAGRIVGGGVLVGLLLTAVIWHKSVIADAKQAQAAETRSQVVKEQEQIRREEENRLMLVIAEKDALIADLSKRRNTITERIIEREKQAEVERHEVDTKDIDRVIDDVVDWAKRSEQNRNRGRVEVDRQSSDRRGTGRGEGQGADRAVAPSR